MGVKYQMRTGHTKSNCDLFDPLEAEQLIPLTRLLLYSMVRIYKDIKTLFFSKNRIICYLICSFQTIEEMFLNLDFLRTATLRKMEQKYQIGEKCMMRS